MHRVKRDPGPENTAPRRPADRTRGRRLVALLLSSPAAVLCGVLARPAGPAVWDADSRAAQELARHRRPVTATTVSAAEPGTGSRSRGRSETVAQAVWLRLVEVRSLARWERDGEAVEPVWSGRTRSEPGPDDD